MSILRKNLSSADRKAIDDYTAIVRSLDAKDATITRLTADNKALTAERDEWRSRYNKALVDIDAATFRADRLSAELAEALKLVELTNDAIAEYIRYLDGGEMRGSYDGKPERNGLRKAHYAARSFLASGKGE